jgi:hypothetical protein
LPGHELVKIVELVVVTDNGEHPEVVFNVNNGTNGDSMQIVLTISSTEHRFPTLNFIVYVPGIVKIGHIVFDPATHGFGLNELKSFPSEPLLNVKPIEGIIFQTSFGVLLQPAELATAPPVDEFVKQIGVFIHEGFVGKVKLATGGVDI